MKFGLVAIALAATLVALTGPAGAEKKHHGKRHVAAAACDDRPTRFDLDFLWSEGNVPRANGCAPAVYQNGKFIGQDPDPNVRLELSRNPAEGDPSQWR
jgi:hypothetical protein